MDIKTKAITISAVDKGEADKIVHLFSVDFGNISATVRGVKKQGAKLASCCFQFAFSEIVLAEKNGYYTVTSCELIEPFVELYSNLDKFEIASAILEVARELNKGSIDYSELFVLSLEALKLLAFEEKVSTSLIWLKYIMSSLSLSGYKINVDFCSSCLSKAQELERLFIDFETGAVFCEKHKPLGLIHEFSKDEYLMLSALQKIQLSEFSGRVLTPHKISEKEIVVFGKKLIEGILQSKLKSCLD